MFFLRLAKDTDHILVYIFYPLSSPFYYIFFCCSVLSQQFFVYSLQISIIRNLSISTIFYEIRYIGIRLFIKRDISSNSNVGRYLVSGCSMNCHVTTIQFDSTGSLVIGIRVTVIVVPQWRNHSYGSRTNDRFCCWIWLILDNLDWFFIRWFSIWWTWCFAFILNRKLQNKLIS